MSKKIAANLLPEEFVLSRALGEASDPKDFDWLKKNIPCQAACPAGTDIPAYLDAIAHRDYETAYRINLRDNVFPAVLGRVCTRPCEPACRHGWPGLGEPVAICFSKRSTADFRDRGVPMVLDKIFPETSHRVAVIGGGAAGLTTARELALWGHQVTVYEQHEQPGGLMVQGIPPFRLPRDIITLEIEQIKALGVDIQCGKMVGRDIEINTLLESNNAVVLAAGTHKPYWPELPGRDLDGVRHGLEYLKKVHSGAHEPINGHVAVIGGGFTAVDCARTAKRLGAERVTVYYRRSEAEMYITGHEIQEMKREGISFVPMTVPLSCEGTNGRVTGLRLASVMLGEPDASGRRAPVPMPDSAFTEAVDHVLLCTGQIRDVSWLDEALAESLTDDGKTHTTVPKLFLAGDYALGALSLIDAIGHAKECARQVDTFLMGRPRWRDVAWIEDARSTGRTRAMDDIPLQPMPTLETADRGLTDEVETGYDETAAVKEAQRCYLCHYKFEIDNELCIYCDRCLKVKPVENCIVKISALQHDADGRITGYTPSTSARDYNLLFIDQNECIRCGACAEVCPVECISLQRVSLKSVPVS